GQTRPPRVRGEIPRLAKRPQRSTAIMNPRLVILLLVLLALLLCLRTRAMEFFVTNLAAFNATVPLLRPGDMVTLANGTWNNADLVFTGQGTAAKPITLRAQTGGSVWLTGSSRLHLAGQYLVARGLFFTNGYPRALDAIEFQAEPYGLATNCQVTDCAIVDFNDPTDTTYDTKWVSLYGFSNRVDHCTFKGKRNNGTLMAVWLPPPDSPDATRHNHHRIDHNYFGQRPLYDGNGAEIIRVGDSTTSFNLSGTVVEENCFEDCDGEI